MDGKKQEQRAGIPPSGEFCCWMMLPVPIVTSVNGPAVSVDQLVEGTVMFSPALTGGFVLRVTRFVRKRKAACRAFRGHAAPPNRGGRRLPTSVASRIARIISPPPRGVRLPRLPPGGPFCRLRTR